MKWRNLTPFAISIMTLPILAAWASVAVAQTEPPNCDDWNTLEFFEVATADDVMACLAMGADVNVQARGETPLYLAAHHGDIGVIQTLIDAGADVNAQNRIGDTALRLAALLAEDVAVIQALLDAGADPNSQDEGGMFPLESAAFGNDNFPAVMEALLTAGADLNLRAIDGISDRTGNTALHSAAWSTSDRAHVMRALIDGGLDVDARNSNGVTPLMRARSLANAEFLLEMGADARRRDVEGYTILHHAAYNLRLLSDTVSLELVVRLVDAGADLNARTEGGETPLHRAAANGAPEMIAALVAHGADVTARDVDGNTALHLAAQCEYCERAGEAIVTLLEAGADAGLRNAQGLTPWDVARENEVNEELSQSEGYWRLNDACFDAPSR